MEIHYQNTGTESSIHESIQSQISLLGLSKLNLDFTINPEAEVCRVTLADKKYDIKADNGRRIFNSTINKSSNLKILVKPFGIGRFVDIAETELTVVEDKLPKISFIDEVPNRFVRNGISLDYKISAADDFGVKYAGIQVKNASSEKTFLAEKWQYIGPPGKKDTFTEKTAVTIDPERFLPGETYLITALAQDFNPLGKYAKTAPLVIRIKHWDKMELKEDDPLYNAFELLKKTIQLQHESLSASYNVKANFEDIVKVGSQKEQLRAVSYKQSHARRTGLKAYKRFKKTTAGQEFVLRLGTLINGEMKFVLDTIKDLVLKDKSLKAKNIDSISDRQKYIYQQLIILLGEIQEKRQKKLSDKELENPEDKSTPPLSPEEFAKQLKDDLKEFMKDQRKILEKSKALLEDGPEDLTAEEEEILGDLAREEAKWAKYFEEKLTDFSKLPSQDFADSSIAEEFNEVFHEVRLASEDLYKKAIELAVPHEQGGLESAEELMHNLEKWLPDTPDYKKWNMEEPPGDTEAPMAELPSELEDIVGDLLDSEDAMTEDVEDASSSYMDSLDKGAGWDAADGPISNMSAKGVTGNQLP
ncbi:MAG: hypothetical protein ACYTFY_22970, partial [Planctomycetota bacterium]